jgi:type I restriction-modification system DNA methylase subunit
MEDGKCKMEDVLKLHTDNEFQTPWFVCEYMVSLMPSDIKTILEPTPGIGNLVAAVVKKHNVKIYAPDDFFLIDFTKRYDLIIMNPPFTGKDAYMTNAPAEAKDMGMRLGYWILTRCMEMSDRLIALMPWFTISDSDIRLKHLVNFGLKSVTPLPRKTFRYARIQTVVLELEKGFKGTTEFKTVFHES